MSIEYIYRHKDGGRVSAGGAVDAVTVGDTTTVVLAAAPGRHCVILSNNGTERIDVAFGTAAIAGKGIGIPVAGTFVITAEHGSMMSINGICASGGMSLGVQTITGTE